MKIIGLTGGIACGKSTVSKTLHALGAYIIDADVLAHELSQPKQPIFNVYVERFGRAVVTAGGTLDRAAVAQRVFSDPAVRAEMDAVTHPLIRAETWVVAIPEEEQLARLLARDKTMHESEARARIGAQMPLAEKCARADIVIDNSGTKEETREYIGKVWSERIIGNS